MLDEVYPNDTPFVKLACDVAFESLTEREKCYAHYLCRASWYGGLIVLFQTSKESPLIFLLLERLFRSQDLDSLRALATEQCNFDEEDFKALLVYAAAFYANMGNYKGFGDNKFIPNLSKEKLHKLVTLSEASKHDPSTMDFLWSHLSGPLYSLGDNEKHLGFPPAGTTTYFSKNCTKRDSEVVGKFLTEKGIEGYITRVFKKATEAGDQDCYEIRYASVLSSDDPEKSELLGCELMDKGRVCFTRGDYSGLLKLTVDNLRKAQECAANENQRQMLGKYIESFTVGSLDAHKDGSRFWTKDKGPSVESYIGFIETYRDPAGMRGEFEGFVATVNRPQSEKFGALVERAESLLRLLPWAQPFEKDQFLRPDFTSLDVVAFAGSGIPAGINIPNYDSIRQNEGFKNVSLGNVINADDKSSKANFLSPEDNEIFNKYKNGSFEVQVGLHELLGHGSGKLFVQHKDGSFNFDRDSVVLPATRFSSLPEHKECAANENQRQMLGKYIESFTVGSLDAHKDGSRFWTKDKGPSVESYIGFIETYRDPAGMRGEFEGFVATVNRPQSEKFGALVERAESLLRLLPWAQPFEKDQFLRPDFTSLDVVAFAGSGIPAGINIPNYDSIRQNEGFKNVSLGNVINADDKSSKANFLSPEDNEIFNKYKNGSFEVQVGLHELLGHGSGKLFVQHKDGSFNFDRDSVVLPATRFSSLPEHKVTSWYKDNETYDCVFGPLGSSYEECRAECVGLHLCTNEDVLRLFGFEGQEGQDVAYVNWLTMVVKGVEGLQTYNPRTKTWLQAHSRARYVIMRVLLEAGDLVKIQETTGEDGKPDLLVSLDRSKIPSVGAPAIEQFLLQLQLYKSTADVKSATELYERYSDVSADEPHPFLKYWDIVMARKKPRRIFVQANTILEGDKVQLKSYEASPEGHLQSWLDRFACSSKDLDRIILETWKKDQDYF